MMRKRNRLGRVCASKPDGAPTRGGASALVSLAASSFLSIVSSRTLLFFALPIHDFRFREDKIVVPQCAEDGTEGVRATRRATDAYSDRLRLRAGSERNGNQLPVTIVARRRC